MAGYRLFGFGPDGHIGTVDTFSADSDAEAIEIATKRGTGATELWCGTRRIARFGTVPRPKGPPPTVLVSKSDDLRTC